MLNLCLRISFMGFWIKWDKLLKILLGFKLGLKSSMQAGKQKKIKALRMLKNKWTKIQIKLIKSIVVILDMITITMTIN